MPQMNMECPICTDKFNKLARKKLECVHCLFPTCLSCTEQYLLTITEPRCMNCQKPWNYEYLQDIMSKKYMATTYRDHIKKYLVISAEKNLAGYQEIAGLRNKREQLLGNLVTMRELIRSLRTEKDSHVVVPVTFEDKHYNILCPSHEERPDVMICRHIHNLVNPPVTPYQEAIQRIRREQLQSSIKNIKYRYSRSLHSIRVHNDKINSAIRADVHHDTWEEPTAPWKNTMLQRMHEITTKLDSLHKKLEANYDHLCNIEESDEWSAELEGFLTPIRTLYKEFNTLLYELNGPPSEEEYTRLTVENTNLKTISKELRCELHRNKLLLEDTQDIRDYHYRYDQDTEVLHTASTTAEHDKQRVHRVLQEQENEQRGFTERTNGQLSTIVPQYEHMLDDYSKIEKECRAYYKRKVTVTEYITGCPSGDCNGRLGTDYRCGLCRTIYCKDCHKVCSDTHECNQDDVDTIRLLTKNTKPCPNCRIGIFKTEGCDQMWCVQCHTTFSWKTGALLNGVIHNPHFLEYRRRIREEQAGVDDTRIPGDIPCGGLPNQVEMETIYKRYISDDLVSYDTLCNLMEIWRLCVFCVDDIMPGVYRRFYNSRAAKYRQYGISYVRGKISKQAWETQLYRQFLAEQKYRHYYDILQTMTFTLADFLRELVGNQDPEEVERKCITLLDHINREITSMCSRYNMKQMVFGGFVIKNYRDRQTAIEAGN